VTAGWQEALNKGHLASKKTNSIYPQRFSSSKGGDRPEKKLAEKGFTCKMATNWK